MNRSVKATLALTVALLASAHAHAQWIKKPSDLDPFNRNGSVNKSARDWDKHRLGWGRLPQDQGSGFMATSPPYIDDDGNIWSGTSNSGQNPRRVGKASLRFNAQGQAFWVSNYRDSYGQVESPVRASRYDRAGGEERRSPVRPRRDDSPAKLRVVVGGRVIEEGYRPLGGTVDRYGRRSVVIGGVRITEGQRVGPLVYRNGAFVRP